MDLHPVASRSAPIRFAYTTTPTPNAPVAPAATVSPPCDVSTPQPYPMLAPSVHHPPPPSTTVAPVSNDALMAPAPGAAERRRRRAPEGGTGACAVSAIREAVV